MNSLSAYRTELEGIFRCQKHTQYLGMTPAEVEQWCDNEQAVKDTDVPIWSPAGMIGADADIILAIHHLQEELGWDSYHCRHIYAHQDEREAPKEG